MRALWTSLVCCACTCGSSPESTAATASARAAASTAPRSPRPLGSGPAGTDFPVDLARVPCEILTARMVAASMGLPEGDLKRRASSRRCIYRFGSGQIVIDDVSVRETAEAARQHFRDTHRTAPETIEGRTRPAPFRRVSGIGDEALLDTGTAALHRLDVRLGNLAFKLTIARDAPPPKRDDRDLVALGQAVVQGLRPAGAGP